MLLAAAICACRQDMHDQPKIKPLRANAFFTHERSARPLVEGVVARGEFRDDETLYTGKSGGTLVTTFPVPVTREGLARGKERYGIFCTPCHDQVGTGRGMVVRRGFRSPPSFHIDRLRQAPVGHFFDVVTSGFGVMPSYSAQIPVEDRWAIVAYVRALQLSQHASLADVPPDVRASLEGSGS